MSQDSNEILESFSANQLRDLALAMNARGMDLPKSGITKDDLLALLKGKRSDEKLMLFAHRIEAVTPYKHLFLYSLPLPTTFKAVRSQVETSYPSLISGFVNVDPQMGKLGPESCVLDEANSRVYVKLVHQVEMSGWVTVSRTEKKLKEFRKRHPVVITIRPLDALLTISFPGFTYTQGMQHNDRVSYAAIAEQGIGFIKDQLKLNCSPFNAKLAIDALLEEEPAEVTEIKRNVRPKQGGRFGFDAGEEAKLTVALKELLREGDISASESQIRALFRRTGASDVVLIWRKLQILTRISLLQGGPEFLFVWRDAGPSSSVVDAVLSKVAAYERALTKPKLSAVRNMLIGTRVKEFVRPATIAQQTGVSVSEVLELMSVGSAREQFEPRFRVQTESILLEFSNTWRKALTEFPQQVTDEHGSVIDLTQPKNIEVAFERVS